MNDLQSAELMPRVGALTTPVLGGRVDAYAKIDVSTAEQLAIVELEFGFPAEIAGEELVESIDDSIRDDTPIWTKSNFD